MEKCAPAQQADKVSAIFPQGDAPLKQQTRMCFIRAMSHAVKFPRSSTGTGVERLDSNDT